MARKGRKRNRKPPLPGIAGKGGRKRSEGRRTVAAATAANFDFAAEMAALGPCPAPRVEAKVKAMFGRQRIGVDFRAAAEYLPEVALAMLGARPRLDLRQCQTVVRLLALEHPDFAAEVAARQDWHRRRDALLARQRQQRALRNGEESMADITVRDRRSGVEVSLFGGDRGTAERGRQDGGTFQTVAPNPDRRSQPVTVARACDPLGRLLRSGTITRAQHGAARRFSIAFSQALFDRYPTVKLGALPSGGDGSSGERLLEARDAVWAAVTALGGQDSDAGDVVWYVVGLGMSLREWVARRRQQRARRLNPVLAAGILTAALDALHRHYEPVQIVERRGDGVAGGIAEEAEDPRRWREGRAESSAAEFEARLAAWHAAAKGRESVS